MWDAFDEERGQCDDSKLLQYRNTPPAAAMLHQSKNIRWLTQCLWLSFTHL